MGTRTRPSKIAEIWKMTSSSPLEWAHELGQRDRDSDPFYALLGPPPGTDLQRELATSPLSHHEHRAANIDRRFPGTCRERRLVRVGSHRGCSRLVYHQPWQHEQDLNFFYSLLHSCRHEKNRHIRVPFLRAVEITGGLSLTRRA